MTRSVTRRLILVSALAATLVLGACATATGPQFTALEAVPAGQVNVVVYRKAALYASGGAYDVALNGKPAGKLFNASYLVIRVAPGEHSFSIDEGPLISLKTFKVTAEAGKRYFVEYDSSKGLLLGWGLLSGSAAKGEPEALADLKELKRAQ